MAREGQLLVNRANEYCLIDRLPVVVGTVSGHRDGFGLGRTRRGQPVLPYREMRMLFHGDRAAGRVTGRDDRGRSEGAIVEVLEHRTRQVAGRFSLEGGIGFVTPDNRRISQRVVVPREATGPARHGDLAVVEITEQPSRNRDAVGRVLRVLPDGGGADTAIDLAIASHGLAHAFSPEALAEARGYGREVTSAPLAGREDLRKMPLVTIDGEDARDFDDAVWAEENAGGFRLIVAIADVSHYVRPGTALDREARERATSVYFPNRVLPMLPEELSNHLCSLMPDVDRLCMACDMQVTRAGDVSRSHFYPAVMRSAARLTYTRVAAHLDGREPASRGGHAAIAPVLDCLHHVYLALRKQRVRRGALDFEAPEVKVLVDSAGQVTDIREYPRNDAHRLIEECMIAANVEAAGFLKKRKLPALFRIHGKPDEERIEELKRFLSMRGVHFEIGGDLKPARLQKVLAGIRAGQTQAFSRTRSSVRCRKRFTSRSTSATSASRSRNTPISLRRSGAIRTCWCIAGSATPWAAAMLRISCTPLARWRRSGRNARCASAAQTKRRARSWPGWSPNTCGLASARNLTRWRRASPSSASSCN